MASMDDYRQTHIISASPMDLVVMLYEECIAALSRAEASFDLDESERCQGISNHLLHAQDIITELSVSLDFGAGGEIAANLNRLYDFMSNHLSAANLSKNALPIREVRALMVDLLDAWRQVAAQAPAATFDASTGGGTGALLASG
ncbi:MAG: flagellar export chaperone FliS [Rhodospirillaceae bacterium]|jgi:flagellar secretion chaperone FliS|nr:flagellar export chaperone FliS [Rhodospirillaceae bacterium]